MLTKNGLWNSIIELSRAFLCSTVLVLDLLIVMQDWDFPHFTNTLDVNLPGLNKQSISIEAVEIQISGKWFNYGIIFLVMIFDLNMWKNQIFYYPQKYGQYIGKQLLWYAMFRVLITQPFSYGASSLYRNKWVHFDDKWSRTLVLSSSIFA